MKNIFTGILVLAMLILGSINTIKAQISTQPVNDSICTGEDAEFSLEASNSPDFQWQSLVQTNWLDIEDNTIYSGVDNDTLQLLSPTTEYADSSYRCIVTDGGDTYTSDTVQLVFNPDLPASITIEILQNGPICLGDQVSFAADPENEGLSPTYQWFIDGNDAGVDNDTLTTGILTDEHEIYCIVISSLPCPAINFATSNVIDVTINPNLPASITIEVMSNDTICSGDEVTFTANPDNAGLTPTYQWFIDGSDIGENNISLTTDTLTVDHEIYCLVISSLPCPVNNYAISDTIEMTLYQALSTNVSYDQEICSGDTPTELTSDPEGGPSPPGYLFQWQDSVPNGNWANIQDSTLEAYHPGPLFETTFFRVILNNEMGCEEHISDPIQISVYESLSTSVSENQEICSGDTPDEIGSAPIGGPTPPDYLFQWQDSVPGGNWTDLPDDTLEAYQPGPLFETTYFRVILNNVIGCKQHISDFIQITVYEALSSIISGDQEICSGDTPDELSSEPYGGPNPSGYLFQWQDSIPNGSWEIIPGGNSQTYQPGPLFETKFFRVILYNDINCNGYISNPIEITVYDALSTNISASQEICSGETPDELSSGPEGGPTPPSYLFQWQDSIPNGSWEDIPGGNSQTYQPGILLETTFFRVIVNNEIGCTEHISDLIKITGIPSVPASISITESKNPVCDNEMVVFSISDSVNGGNNPEFVWKLNNESEGTAATWSSFVSDNDEVYLQMNSNAECVNNNPVNSNTITMSVNTSPVLLNSGLLVPKPISDPVVLICVDSSETNIYHWFENGVEIPTADEQFFYPRKYGLTFNFNSEYYVMLENEFCFSSSNSYTYTINKSGLFEESGVFVVYPNPNSGNFSLVLNEELLPEDFESCTIRILDVTGKVVFGEEVYDVTHNVELSGIQKGLYFLEVKISESHHQVRKLIID